MRTLVLGGIRSGKSQWAEATLGREWAETASGNATVRYIATGGSDATDPAWANRIAAHQDRRPPNWETVETVDVATQLASNLGTPTLVDDVGCWLTAALDQRGWGSRSVAAEVDEFVSAVRGFTGPLVLVSPEVGLTVVPATESGRRFADELGILNQRLAEYCDRVVLVVAGLPVWLKPANTEVES